jgi:hypothetical protein
MMSSGYKQSKVFGVLKSKANIFLVHSGLLSISLFILSVSSQSDIANATANSEFLCSTDEAINAEEQESYNQESNAQESDLSYSNGQVEELQRIFDEIAYSNVDSQRAETLWDPLTKMWLTEDQVHLLKIAFDIGFADGGIKQAKLVQGVLLQETIAGLLGRIGHMTAKVGKRSYGVMQVKVSAARDVLRRHPSLGEFNADEELIAKLILDDMFNIKIASKHLLHLKKKSKNEAQTMMAYNIGLRASRRYETYDTFKYVRKVKQYFKHVVEPFNNKYFSDYQTTVTSHS